MLQIPEVSRMSEHAVRMLRNILKVCSWKFIQPVTCLPSSSADLNVVRRKCIGPNIRWAVCYDCMCVYFLFYLCKKCEVNSIMVSFVGIWTVNHSLVIINCGFRVIYDV
jgi:hypothetical protein